ncbi:MAG: TonB-dependent receptor [Bacteroidia bacterium]|nr:TonB-dependent receptor [Bacteroidia bacterium]
MAKLTPVFGQGLFQLKRSYENEPLLEVLEEWEASYGIRFTYSPNELKDLKLSAEIDAENLKEAVEQLLRDCPLDKKWSDKNSLLLRYNPNWTRPWKLLVLSGRVRDQHTGQRLSYASLFVPGSRFGTTADENGSFFLQIPDTLSTQKLICRYLGYKAKSIPIQSAKSFMEIGMVQDENSLPAIEIEDLGKNLVSPLENGKYDIKLGIQENFISLNQQNPLALIQYLPGINATSENLSQLSVRGGQRDENLVMLDQIPLYNVDHYLGIFSIFSPDAVSGFSFYQTDFPIEYGGRTSSILAIRGENPDLEQNSFKVGADLFSVNASMNLVLNKKVGLYVSARGSDTRIGTKFTTEFDEIEARGVVEDKILEDSLGREVANVPIPELKFYDLYAKLYIKSSAKSRLELTFFDSKDRMDFLGNVGGNKMPPKQIFPMRELDSTGRPRPVGLNVVRHETGWDNRGASLSHIQNWSEGFSSKTYGFFSNYDRFFQYQTYRPGHPNFYQFNDTNQIRSYGIGHYSRLVKGLNTLEAGFSLKNMEVSYDKNIKEGGLADSTKQRPKFVDLGNSSLVAEFYASYTLWIKERLRLKMGLRETYLQSRDEWLHSPRVSAAFLLSENLSLKASAGIYNQYLREIYQMSVFSTSEAYWSLADDEAISVSSATHLSIGANWSSSQLSFNVEYYYKSLDGLINESVINNYDEQDRPLAVPVFFDGEGFSTGLDANLQVSTGRYSAWFSYSLGFVRHQFDELNKGEPFFAQEDQRHQFKLVNNYKLNKWNFSCSYIFGSGRPYLVWNAELAEAVVDQDWRKIRLPQERLPDYHRFDVGATYMHDWKINGKTVPIQLGASIFNVFNRSNVSFKQFVVSVGQDTEVGNIGRTDVIGSRVPLLGATPNLSFGISF